MKKIVHFGCGNIGKALIGPLFKENNFNITYIDNNLEVVNSLSQNNEFKIYSASGSGFKKIKDFNILHLESPNAVPEMLSADIITTSIGQDNLKHLVSIFKNFFDQKDKHSTPVNIICVENGKDVSSYFKSLFDGKINDNIHFVDCIVDKICVNSKDIDKNDVISEDYFHIGLNNNHWTGEKLNNVDYYDDLNPYLLRKLWMLNSTHSLIAWLLWNEYDYINEIEKDKSKSEIVKKYMDEIVITLKDNFPEFNYEELLKYKNDVYNRFINKGIKDSVYRVGRNFKIKLSKNERFISLLDKSKNQKFFRKILILIYEINLSKGIDEEIKSYTEKNNIEHTLKKYSSI